MFPKVLIVDDSESIHALVSLHLQAEQTEVYSAYDGRSALELIAALRPDLVLLDVDMPEMSGFEVCRRLRENPLTMNLPIIFLTAATSTGEKVCGLDLGACDYVTKPFEPAELVARVSATLRVKSRIDFLAEKRVAEFMGAALATEGTRFKSLR